jgi:hypothetical protein
MTYPVLASLAGPAIAKNQDDQLILVAQVCDINKTIAP